MGCGAGERDSDRILHVRGSERAVTSDFPPALRRKARAAIAGAAWAHTLLRGVEHKLPLSCERTTTRVVRGGIQHREGSGESLR